MKEVIIFEIFGIIIGILIKNIHRIFPFLVKTVTETVTETVIKTKNIEIFLDTSGLHDIIKMLVHSAETAGEQIDVLYLPPVYLDAIVGLNESDRRLMSIHSGGRSSFGFQHGSHTVILEPSDSGFRCTYRGNS